MMRSKRINAVLLSFVLLFGAAEHGAASSQKDRETIKKAAQSVLWLEAMDDKNQTIGFGSGFVIIDNYTLVTSFRLVRDADWVAAYNSCSDFYMLSKVIAADERMDIALLEFYSPTNLKPIPLRPFEAHFTSYLVTAIGGPQEDQNDMAPGTVGGVHREDDLSIIQFEADLKQGMDGGALIDITGQVSGLILGPVNGGQGTYRALDIQDINSFAQTHWKQERVEFYDYFRKDDVVKEKIDEWLLNQWLSTPALTHEPAYTPKPTEAPKGDTDFFLLVGNEAYWDKKDGYWQVNPKVVNNSKLLSADSFTLSFYCEDENGDFILRFGEGGYVTDAVFDMVLRPGEDEYPGYTWLDGYENVKCINMAISGIHTTDGRTIEIPMEEWQVMFIKLE